MKSYAPLFLFLAACGGVETTRVVDMAGPVDLQEGPGTLCADPRADAYQVPLAKSSAAGRFTVTLVESVPGPPNIGTDTWTLQVADMQQQPINNAMIAVKPWMPDHGHGTGVKATVTPSDSDGHYSVTPLYLFMAGYWVVTFTITPSDGSAADTVAFSFCLADQ